LQYSPEMGTQQTYQIILIGCYIFSSQPNRPQSKIIHQTNFTLLAVYRVQQTIHKWSNLHFIHSHLSPLKIHHWLRNTHSHQLCQKIYWPASSEVKRQIYCRITLLDCYSDGQTAFRPANPRFHRWGRKTSCWPAI
jgi:hypothetical protein